MRFSRVRVIALSAALLPACVFGQDMGTATTQPAGAAPDQPVVKIEAGPSTAPSTQPAEKPSAEAQALLDQVRDAYGKVGAIHMTGKFSAKLDVADQPPKTHKAQFDATFQSPNRFQQSTTGETPDEAMTIGSTGEKLYIFSPSQKQYMTKDAPKERGSGKNLPFARMLLMQNPALLFAVSADAEHEMLDDTRLMAMGPNTDLSHPSVRTIALGADQKIDDANFKELKITDVDGGDISILVNADTHLLRRLTVDLKSMLTRAGQPGVKEATLSYDYTTTELNPATKPDQFAWIPPDGAKEAEKPAAAQRDDADGPARALEGQPAPDFKLNGLDGKPVSLADLKGSVVVLDFWATWCGPCKASLPLLDKTAREYAGKGVKFYAVNLQEKQDVVSTFVSQQKLSLPVLLDVDGNMSAPYKINSIPETLILGKDGIVRKIFIGFDTANGEAGVKEAIDAALK